MSLSFLCLSIQAALVAAFLPLSSLPMRKPQSRSTAAPVPSFLVWDSETPGHGASTSSALQRQDTANGDTVLENDGLLAISESLRQLEESHENGGDPCDFFDAVVRLFHTCATWLWAPGDELREEASVASRFLWTQMCSAGISARLSRLVRREGAWSGVPSSFNARVHTAGGGLDGSAYLSVLRLTFLLLEEEGSLKGGEGQEEEHKGGAEGFVRGLVFCLAGTANRRLVERHKGRERDERIGLEGEDENEYLPSYLQSTTSIDVSPQEVSAFFRFLAGRCRLAPSPSFSTETSSPSLFGSLGNEGDGEEEEEEGAEGASSFSPPPPEVVELFRHLPLLLPHLRLHGRGNVRSIPPSPSLPGSPVSASGGTAEDPADGQRRQEEFEAVLSILIARVRLLGATPHSDPLPVFFQHSVWTRLGVGVDRSRKLLSGGNQILRLSVMLSGLVVSHSEACTEDELWNLVLLSAAGQAMMPADLKLEPRSTDSHPSFKRNGGQERGPWWRLPLSRLPATETGEEETLASILWTGLPPASSSSSFSDLSSNSSSSPHPNRQQEQLEAPLYDSKFVWGLTFSRLLRRWLDRVAPPVLVPESEEKSGGGRKGSESKEIWREREGKGRVTLVGSEGEGEKEGRKKNKKKTIQGQLRLAVEILTVVPVPALIPRMRVVNTLAAVGLEDAPLSFISALPSTLGLLLQSHLQGNYTTIMNGPKTPKRTLLVASTVRLMIGLLRLQMVAIRMAQERYAAIRSSWLSVHPPPFPPNSSSSGTGRGRERGGQTGGRGTQAGPTSQGKPSEEEVCFVREMPTFLETSTAMVRLLSGTAEEKLLWRALPSHTDQIVVRALVEASGYGSGTFLSSDGRGGKGGERRSRKRERADARSSSAEAPIVTLDLKKGTLRTFPRSSPSEQIEISCPSRFGFLGQTVNVPFRQIDKITAVEAIGIRAAGVLVEIAYDMVSLIAEILAQWRGDLQHFVRTYLSALATNGDRPSWPAASPPGIPGSRFFLPSLDSAVKTVAHLVWFLRYLSLMHNGPSRSRVQLQQETVRWQLRSGGVSETSGLQAEIDRFFVPSPLAEFEVEWFMRDLRGGSVSRRERERRGEEGERVTKWQARRFGSTSSNSNSHMKSLVFEKLLEGWGGLASCVFLDPKAILRERRRIVATLFLSPTGLPPSVAPLLAGLAAWLDYWTDTASSSQKEDEGKKEQAPEQQESSSQVGGYQRGEEKYPHEGRGVTVGGDEEAGATVGECEKTLSDDATREEGLVRRQGEEKKKGEETTETVNSVSGVDGTETEGDSQQMVVELSGKGKHQDEETGKDGRDAGGLVASNFSMRQIQGVGTRVASVEEEDEEDEDEEEEEEDSLSQGERGQGGISSVGGEREEGNGWPSIASLRASESKKETDGMETVEEIAEEGGNPERESERVAHHSSTVPADTHTHDFDLLTFFRNDRKGACTGFTETVPVSSPASASEAGGKENEPQQRNAIEMGLLVSLSEAAYKGRQLIMPASEVTTFLEAAQRYLLHNEMPSVSITAVAQLIRAADKANCVNVDLLAEVLKAFRNPPLLKGNEWKPPLPASVNQPGGRSRLPAKFTDGQEAFSPIALCCFIKACAGIFDTATPGLREMISRLNVLLEMEGTTATRIKGKTEFLVSAAQAFGAMRVYVHPLWTKILNEAVGHLQSAIGSGSAKQFLAGLEGAGVGSGRLKMRQTPYMCGKLLFFSDIFLSLCKACPDIRQVPHGQYLYSLLENSSRDFRSAYREKPKILLNAMAGAREQAPLFALPLLNLLDPLLYVLRGTTSGSREVQRSCRPRDTLPAEALEDIAEAFVVLADSLHPTLEKVKERKYKSMAEQDSNTGLFDQFNQKDWYRLRRIREQAPRWLLHNVDKISPAATIRFLLAMRITYSHSKAKPFFYKPIPNVLNSLYDPDVLSTAALALERVFASSFLGAQARNIRIALAKKALQLLPVMTPDDVVTVAAALDTRPRKEPWGFNFNNFPVLSRFEGLLSPPASSDPFDAFHHSNPQQQQQTLGSSSRVMNIDIDRRVHPEGSGLDFDSSAVLSEDVLVFHKATWRYAAQMVAFLTPQEQAALYFTAARVFPSALAVPPTAAERAEAESLHKALKAGKIQSPPLNLSELPLSELIQCLYASEAIRAQIRAHAAQAAQLVAAVEAERETGKTNKGYRHSESTAQAPPEQFELDPSFLIFTETLPLTRYSSEDFEAEIIKRIGASSPSQGALSVMDLGRVIRWRCETLKQVKRDTQIGETLKKSGLASALGVNVSEEQAAADEAAEGNDTIIRDKFILACLRRLTSHFVSSNPLASVARGVERLEEIRAAQAARRGTGSADAVRAQAIQRRQQDSSQRKDERYAFLSSVQALRLIWREISESVLSHQQELLDDEGGGGSEEKGGKRGALVSTAELLSLYDQALGALVSYGLRAASEGGMSLDEICALYALLHDTTGQHTMVFSDRQMICVEDAPPPLPETVVERLRERGDSSEASQPFDWSQHLLSQTVRGDGRMNPGVEALRLGRGGTRSAFLGRDRGAFYSNQAPARPHGPTLRLPWRQIYSAFASRVLSTLKERTRRFSEQIAENTYTEEEIENNNRNKKFLPPMIFDGMWKVKAFYVASVCRDLARSQVLDPEIWQGLSKMVVVYREFLTLEDCKQILVALLWLLTEYVQAVMNGPIGDGVEWKEEEERNSQGQQRQKQRQSDSSVLAQSLSGPFPPPVDKTTKVSEDTREYLLSLLTADPEEDEEEEEESTLSKAAAENKHPATPAGGLADMRSLSGSSFLHAALESSSLTGPPSEPPLLSKPLKTLEALRAILLAVQAVNSRVRLFLKHEWEEPARIPKKTSPMLKRFIGISHAMGKSYLPGLARLGPAIDRLESQAKGVLLSSSAGQQQMQQGNLQETGEGQGVERGTLRISGLATGVRLETSRCLEQSRFLSLSVQNRIFGIGYSMSLSELSHLIGEEMGPFGVSSFFRIDSRLHSSRSRRGPSGKGEDVVRSSADGPFGFRWAAVGERERKRLASELAKRGVATPDEEAFGDQLMDVPQEEREERGRALFAFPAGELDDDGDDNEGRRKNRNAASGEETGEEMERGDTGLVDIEPDGGFVPDVVMSRIGNCAFDPSRILQFLQLLSVRETAEMLRWGWATRTLTVPFAELALLRIKSSWEWAQHQKEQPESKKGKRGRDRDGAGAPSQSTLTPPQTVLIARILEQLPSHSPVWLSDLSLSPSPPVADSLEEDEEGDEETAASARHRGSIEGLEDDWGDAGEPAESEYEEYNSDFRETSSADWKSGGRLEEIESWEEDEPEWEGRGRERGEGVQNRRGQWGHRQSEGSKFDLDYHLKRRKKNKSWTAS